MTATSSEIGEQIIQVGAHAANALYKLVKLCAAFDGTVEWALDGMPTAAHWIAEALDVEVCTAREWVRIGKKLHELPLIDEAFANRRISYSKVRALTRFADSDNERELLLIALNIPAGRLNRALAAWSMKAEGQDKINERHRRQRGLFAGTEPDGAFKATLNLTALAGARIMAAIDAKVMQNRSDASADASLAQRRADALVELVTEGPAKVETEVIIHVRGDGCEFDDGSPVAGSIVERIAPESFLRVMIHEAERLPINASGRHRHPSTRQKRVVKERDRRCVDCGAEVFLEYDHLPDYEQSKRTLVDELQLRCSKCHAKRHKEAA